MRMVRLITRCREKGEKYFRYRTICGPFCLFEREDVFQIEYRHRPHTRTPTCSSGRPATPATPLNSCCNFQRPILRLLASENLAIFYSPHMAFVSSLPKGFSKL
jgi:hypothetical protein